MDRAQLIYIIPSAIILALGVSMAFIPLIIKLSQRFNLVDTPNSRSSHHSPTPTMGGVAVFLGFISVALIFGYYIEGAPLLFSALCIIFACGFFDDIFEISPLLRLLGEFAAAFLVCFAGLRLSSFHGLMGIEEIPVFLQYAITMVLLVGITNAFNLIDGIDGLAGGIGVINALVLGGVYLFSDRIELALISFALSGALLGFLYYNFNPASIFMGDSGSLPVGFILAVLGFQLLETNVVVNGNTLNSHSTILLVMGILFLPVFDFIRVTIQRISHKKSPFKADKSHVHHLLVKIGFSHKTSTIILYCTNIAILSLTFIMKDFWIEVSMLLLFIICYLSIEFMSIKKIKNIDDEINTINVDKGSFLRRNRLLDN